MNREEIEKQLAMVQKKLDQYMPIFLEKKRNFRGVKHEDSLSELRYTEFMVYRNMVEGLIKRVSELKAKLRNS